MFQMILSWSYLKHMWGAESIWSASNLITEKEKKNHILLIFIFILVQYTPKFFNHMKRLLIQVY